jgi:dGTPase
LAGQADRTQKSKTDRSSLLEVQLVDAADSTAYDAHDTDDAVKLGLVTIDQLQQVPLIRRCVAAVRSHYPGLTERFLHKAVVHQLVNLQVTDMIEYCRAELHRRNFGSAVDAMESDFRVGPSPELAGEKRELEAFLFQNVYRHPRLVSIRQQAHEKIQTLWQIYVDDPSRLPKKYQRRANEIGIHQMAGQYIAGMTDRFFEDTYRLMVQSR